ncbi:MAG: TIGR03936 family radical SAM-associated protein [Coriobacteriia bacterium]|nr:TIGR03936 family radical SAM-associated protein [Coriobacteriia bacterium]
MAEFRLRIGFAKTGAALWLSHLELVRAMERCVRRSGLPYAISQGFNPHMKHSFSAALPVGTASLGEYMDVELVSLVKPAEALMALRAVEHYCLPIHTAEYAQKDEASLQVAFNKASYCIELADMKHDEYADLLKRLLALTEITVLKKGKPKTYDLNHYLVDAWASPGNHTALHLSLLSRPEGSLRPEVILHAAADSDYEISITSITRTALEQA